MNNDSEVLALLNRVGAIITNSHIVYTSGRHGSSYINKDALYPHTTETSYVCSRIAAYFADANIDVVAGPTLGGIILAQWVAHHLGNLTGKAVQAVYAEEEGEGDNRRRVFRRGYGERLLRKRVLVVEDVLNTGGSAQKVINAVYAMDAKPVGLGALCNRGGLTAQDFGVSRFYALVKLDMASWEPDECPLCQQGVPINTRVGKGR